MNDKRTTHTAGNLPRMEIEARMSSGQPFTYSELCSIAALHGGDEGETRLCDKTIQKWRRNGWIEMHGWRGRSPLWRLTKGSAIVAAGGVTEAQIKRAVDAALGEPENARRAADPDHPEADYAAGRVDAAQCVREALTAALAVGDEGIREGHDGK